MNERRDINLFVCVCILTQSVGEAEGSRAEGPKNYLNMKVTTLLCVFR